VQSAEVAGACDGSLVHWISWKPIDTATAPGAQRGTAGTIDPQKIEAFARLTRDSTMPTPMPASAISVRSSTLSKAMISYSDHRQQRRPARRHCRQIDRDRKCSWQLFQFFARAGPLTIDHLTSDEDTEGGSTSSCAG
jgi:hypothetical protein